MNLIVIDQDFDKLEGVIKNINGHIIRNVAINTTVIHKHVEEIERSIFSTKDSVRSI